MDIRREHARVRDHLARARRARVPATLALDEWLATLSVLLQPDELAGV